MIIEFKKSMNNSMKENTSMCKMHLKGMFFDKIL
jgi:hypothetical protein